MTTDVPNDKALQAQKMEALGHLASGVAHDFNNVLTVIMSYATFLEENLSGDSVNQSDAIEIRRAAERGAALTRQLLTLGRQGVAMPRAIDIDTVLEGFTSTIRRLVGEDVVVVIDRVPTPPVMIDPNQFEQIIMNLVVNARDAMPEGGRITIETAVVEYVDDAAELRGVEPGRYIQIGITDTGVGMDRETAQRIFEPFFTTKEAGRGTGLGLAIVHGIVTQAGGTISVYSEIDHGTTFRVHLPVTAESMAIAPLRPSSPDLDALPPLTILVVDDLVEIRTIASRVLQQSGCTVIEATSSEQARRICLSHEGSIDVVVLDVVLPDGRGDLLIDHLVELRPQLASVLMSGFPAGLLAAERRALPEVLAKPFTPGELRAAVARTIAPSGAIDPATAKPLARPKQRVLVVDDDDTFRKLVDAVLTKAGFEVTSVEDGARALEAIAHRFDAIVSDVMMPGISGVELLQHVRRVDLDVPIILMSGTPDVESATKAIEFGAFRYVTKPLDYMKFVELVRHATRAHALGRIRREAQALTGAAKRAADRAGVEVQFEAAMDGLYMVFQPIVTAAGTPFGVEALMRSREHAMSNPMAILEAAEQLGRLPSLGRRIRGLAAAGAPSTGMLFVNLHPNDLFDAALIDTTAPLAALAQRVVLEITERSSLAWTPDLATRVARLRQMGFKLAIDDIGAGYSGLTSFAEITPEIVKIDMSLIRDVHRSTLKQRTIAALCTLCHEIGSQVVAEGIETIDERDVLVGLGCDLLQGYLIGRPA